MILSQKFTRTHHVPVSGLSEQHFRNISQGESEGRSCQHYGGHVIVNFTESIPEQPAAQLIQVNRHYGWI